MKSTKVASRYAKALLELAVEQGRLDSVSGDMNFLLSASEESRDFELLISSPIVKADKKISIFEQVFDSFEDLSMMFIRLITRNGRENLLPAIASEFSAQVKNHKGIVPVTLKSVKPLNADTKSAIMAKLDTIITGTPEVTEEIDESLIGGFVVRMGDVQIDASVSSQLNNLKQRLTR